MKKNLYLFPILTITILLTSCGKEYSANTNTDTSALNKVKTYTEDITSSYYGNSVTTYNLAYDTNDRLISITSITNSGNKSLFSFPTNSLYTMDLYNSGSLAIHEDFYLNSNFYLDSTFQYNNTKDSSTEKYFYNTSNQLIKMNEYSYSAVTGSKLINTTTNTYDGNGDLIESLDLNSNVNTLEYYLDLSYAMPFAPGPVNANSSKKNHLLKRHSLSSNNYLIDTATFTYTFDTKNRISTEKAIVSDGSIVIKTYTYF